MRNRLATAALIALLAMIADVRRPAAQPAQAEGTSRESLAPTGLQSADVHEAQLAPRKPPNRRKIAEKNGYISGSASWRTSQASFLAWASSLSNPEHCRWGPSCASIARIA